MLIEKGKLARSRSFVLKSSVLEQAMSEAKITTRTHLIHGDGRIFFDAAYWMPNPNVPYDRFYVRAGAVERDVARDARAFMEQEVVPEFIAWAKEVLEAPINATLHSREPSFSRSFNRSGS